MTKKSSDASRWFLSEVPQVIPRDVSKLHPDALGKQAYLFLIGEPVCSCVVVCSDKLRFMGI
jgi:hypothetical protein